MKPIFIRLLALICLVNYAIPSFSAVSKEQLRNEVEIGIISSFREKLHKDSSNDPETERKLQAQSERWSKLVDLLPEKEVDDSAAEWIKDSIIRRGSFYGPYFLIKGNSSLGAQDRLRYRTDVQDDEIAQLSKIIPLLTSTKISEVLKQRDDWFMRLNEYRQGWSVLIIEFMSAHQKFNLTQYGGGFAKLIDGLTEISWNRKKYMSGKNNFKFNNSNEASIALSAALAFNVDEMVHMSYNSLSSEINYVFSPIYYPDIYPFVHGIRVFSDEKNVLKNKLNNLNGEHNGTKFLDVEKLNRTIWDGFQLFYNIEISEEIKENSKHQDDSAEFIYLSFENKKYVWERLQAKTLEVRPLE